METPDKQPFPFRAGAALSSRALYRRRLTQSCCAFVRLRVLSAAGTESRFASELSRMSLRRPALPCAGKSRSTHAAGVCFPSLQAPSAVRRTQRAHPAARLRGLQLLASALRAAAGACAGAPSAPAAASAAASCTAGSRAGWATLRCGFSSGVGCAASFCRVLPQCAARSRRLALVRATGPAPLCAAVLPSPAFFSTARRGGIELAVGSVALTLARAVAQTDCGSGLFDHHVEVTLRRRSPRGQLHAPRDPPWR